MQDSRLPNQNHYVILKGHKHLGSGNWIETTALGRGGGAVKTDKRLQGPSILPLCMKPFRFQRIDFCEIYVRDIY